MELWNSFGTRLGTQVRDFGLLLWRSAKQRIRDALGMFQRSCTYKTSGEEVKTSVTQKEKSKGICMEGCPRKYHFLLFLRIHN